MKCTAYKNGDRIEVWLGISRSLEKDSLGQYKSIYSQEFDGSNGSPGLILETETSIKKLISILDRKQKQKMEKGFVFYPDLPNSWFKRKQIDSKKKEMEEYGKM